MEAPRAGGGSGDDPSTQPGDGKRDDGETGTGAGGSWAEGKTVVFTGSLTR